MISSELKPGLPEPVRDAQTIFRALLEAMSRPGKVLRLDSYCESSGPLTPEISAVALTLLDYETPFWLSRQLRQSDVINFLSFHTGAPNTEDIQKSSFCLINDINDMPPEESLPVGTPEFPDRSATVILNVENFNTGYKVQLSGPGIEEKISFSASSLNETFWKKAQSNNSLYPLGIDFIFCGESSLAALPRSTKIEM